MPHWIGLLAQMPDHIRWLDRRFTNDELPEGIEVVGSGYRRIQMPTLIADGQVPGEVSLSNSEEIRFPEATGIWGAVAGFGIYDQEREGHLLFYGPFSFTRTIGLRDTVVLGQGDLSLHEDDLSVVISTDWDQPKAQEPRPEAKTLWERISEDDDGI